MGARKGYKFVGHTADVEFVAYGKDMEACFKSALMAMFETMAYIKKVASSNAKSTSFTVKDRAGTIEDLLWYALQDTLSIADSRSIFAYKVSGISIKKGRNNYSISVRVHGKKREESASKLDVKGVSRYDLRVKGTKNRIKATVVLDV
jgi:protein archease